MVLVFFIAIVCYLPIIDTLVPSTNFGAGVPDIGPVRFGSYLLSLAFLVHLANTRRIRLNGYIIILAGFYIVVIASVSWSNYSYGVSTLQQLINTVFMPFFLALVATNLFTNERNKILHTKHVVISSAILSVMSIFQAILAILTQQEAFRARGTFGDANSLAIFLVLSLPCIIHATENRLFPRSIGLGILFSVIFGIICTVSRKGIATMVLCIFLFNIIKKRYKQIAISLFFFILLGGLFSGYAFISHRFEKSVLQDQFQRKWNMTVGGWDMFRESPLKGLGYKGYYDNYAEYTRGAWRDKYDAHNIFITALANYGFIGFVPFMAIFIYPLFLSIRTIRHEKNYISSGYSPDWATVCVCSVIPFMISGWFSGGLFYSPVEVTLLYTNIMLFLCHKT